MRLHSLAARLVLLACLSIGVALGTISFVLGGQFSRYFEDRVYAELSAHLDQLTANISFEDNQDIAVAPLLDPRFEAPFSGLYWQARLAGHPQVASRSLWTGRLDVPPPTQAGVLTRSEIAAPTGEQLLALTRAVRIGGKASPSLVGLTVAIEASEVQEAAAGFQATMLRWMAIIFVGLILAAWVQVKLGLAPLETLRKKVERVRNGKDSRLEGQFPTEVQPLAREVNELLDLHETTVTQARARASDLAHGLKTPLTIINTVARDLRKQGQDKAAAEIESQIASMSHFIERELARVRVRTARVAAAPARPVAEKMLDAIKRFPCGESLEWQLDMPADFTTPFDAHDLSELLGNQLDNARKWAKSVVRLSGHVRADGTHVLIIEDDGTGVNKTQRAKLGHRGRRLDPAAQGSGLGLAICADLAAHYDAEFLLERSDLGGLKASFIWQPTP